MDHRGDLAPLALPARLHENMSLTINAGATQASIEEERRPQICSRPAASGAHQYFILHSIFCVRLLPKA